VTDVHERDDSLTVTLDGSGRQVKLGGDQLENLRLAYAQHVYRQQGATVERSVVVTGGWQTSREIAYVQASRARDGTEWFLAGEELGVDDQDERRVEQLAAKMRNSRAHTSSLQHRELPDLEWGPGFEHPVAPSRRVLPGVTRSINRTPSADRVPEWTR
jgi:ATP-dependent exoDNAse (exonuclease V) alpha subunit